MMMNDREEERDITKGQNKLVRLIIGKKVKNRAITETGLRGL
jgi:hypothetical protein